MTDLVVHFSAVGERSVLRLAGELDLDSVSELRLHAEAELAAGRCRTLAIDMAELTFIDSTGLGLLVELRRTAAASQITFELQNVPARVVRVISIAGLAETLGVHSDDAPAAG